MIILWEHTYFFETLIGQFLALLTFFAFPIIQYYTLKRFIKREGQPGLWYLPAYGFRLVIRNIPNKRILSGIKYKSFTRKFIPKPKVGSSVGTVIDDIILESEDFFLFPGYDQIIICFRIEGSTENELKFILTDKLGKSQKEFQISSFDRIISDYTATVKNILNFDMKISKRVEIYSSSLVSYWKSINESNFEKSLSAPELLI